MNVLLIGVVVALVVLLYRYRLLLKGIEQVRKQMVTIHEVGETNQLVANPHNFSELEKMVREINILLLESKKHYAHFQEIEQELKEQITNVSHDLRTPLASIIGYFELMNDDITTNEQEQYLDIIKKRAKLLQQLIDNYYNLVQVELEEQELQMSSVNVINLLNDVLATFYYDFSDKKMIIEFEEKTAELTVLADEQLLQRVFVNLFQNVLKHGSDACVISHNSDGRTTIKNKFKTISQIEIEKVFNRLYSVDKTRNNGNTGIGLTIAQVLLEKMGHKIRAELTEDSCFLIEIIWQL